MKQAIITYFLYYISSNLRIYLFLDFQIFFFTASTRCDAWNVVIVFSKKEKILLFIKASSYSVYILLLKKS